MHASTAWGKRKKERKQNTRPEIATATVAGYSTSTTRIGLITKGLRLPEKDCGGQREHRALEKGALSIGSHGVIGLILNH